MAKLLEKIILQVQGSVSHSSPVPGWVWLPVWWGARPVQTTETTGSLPELRSWHPPMWGEQHFTRGFFSSGQKSLSLWHCQSSIHCHEAIMSGLCNVCDYLSNCHCGIVCQFLLFNREKRETGKQRARSGNSNVYLAEISQCEEQDKTPAQWKSHSNRVTWMLHGCLGDAIKAQLLFSPNLSRSGQTQVSQD